MITNEQLINIFIDGFWQIVKNWMIILKPWLLAIIVFIILGLIGFIIEKILLGFLKQYLILTGNSKKNVKKKVSKAKDIIDLGNSANDIHNTFK